MASYQSFGAKLDSDLRSPAKHWPSSSILVHVSDSQHAKAIFLPACSIFSGSVTHWKAFGSWERPRVIRTPHVGNCFVVGLAVGLIVGRGVGLAVGVTVSALSSAAHAAGRPASPAWHSSPVHW